MPNTIDIDALRGAIDAALAGDTTSLFALLSANGGTDRGTIAWDVADAFATAVASRGAAADALIESMAAMSRVPAPGGSPEEFLTVAGVVALGERAARDASRLDAGIKAIERASLDKREPVLLAADEAMTRMGAGHGPKLLVDRFSQYLKTSNIDSHVLTALGRPQWLDTFTDPEPIIVKLDQAFRQAAKSPPLYDTEKRPQRLKKVLETLPATIAKKFPDAIVAFLTTWTSDSGKRIPGLIASNRALLEPSLASRIP
jgi:hypothetical protein